MSAFCLDQRSKVGPSSLQEWGGGAQPRSYPTGKFEADSILEFVCH